MRAMDRIDLAHEPELRLGRLTIRPALRQIVRDANEKGGGAEEVVEPRVMQVLVALAREPATILSRDDLTTSCWEGRVVGEDAINRVISRLRRVAEGVGEGGFRIETITKVGYRLIPGEGVPAPAPAPDSELAAARDEARKLRLDRRAMLIGGGAAVVAAGGWWTMRHWGEGPADRTPPPEVAALVLQAGMAMQQGTAEGNTQSLGLLRKVVEIRPDYADGWGMLALTYATASKSRAPQFESDFRARAQAAIARARELEPGNVYAGVAGMTLLSRMGNWLGAERTLRAALDDHPGNQMLLTSLSATLASVGRARESADWLARALAVGPPSPGLVYSNVQVLWAAGRLEDADRAMAVAYALYPSHFAVWFTRYYLFLYTGRAQEALAMSANLEGRPTGIPDNNFPMIDTVARAMLSRKPADIDAAMKTNMAAARTGAGFAENTIQFASALGRVDTAFELANAYYFGRGFDVDDRRFTAEQRIYTRRENRRTQFLFYPSTMAMRADPRFAALVEEVGLVRYWREAGVSPDYRKPG